MNNPMNTRSYRLAASELIRAIGSEQPSLFFSFLNSPFNGEPRHYGIHDETADGAPFSLGCESYAFRFLAGAVDEESCSFRP
jgi:hypothetical protein